MSTDGDRLMSNGRLFDRIGAAAAKYLLPKFSNLHRRDVSWWFNLDRRERDGGTELAIYAGMQVRVHLRPCK